MMVITPQNIVRHELIGLEVKVVDCANKFNSGLLGKVVNETQKTIVVSDGHKDRRIFKEGTVFQFKLPLGKAVRVDGAVLRDRPWERIKKKLR